MSHPSKHQFIKEHFFLYNHRRNSIFHPFMISLGVTAVLVGLFEIFRTVDLWANMRLAGGNTLHFCEATIGRLVKQPANTWSNLAYIIPALIILYYGFKIKNRYRESVRTALSFQREVKI